MKLLISILFLTLISCASYQKPGSRLVANDDIETFNYSELSASESFEVGYELSSKKEVSKCLNQLRGQGFRVTNISKAYSDVILKSDAEDPYVGLVNELTHRYKISGLLGSGNSYIGDADLYVDVYFNDNNTEGKKTYYKCQSTTR